jgi:hypothetical protein
MPLSAAIVSGRRYSANAERKCEHADYLPACARRQHGVRELWAADRDFGRFAGINAVNPLIGVPPAGP